MVYISFWYDFANTVSSSNSSPLNNNYFLHKCHYDFLNISIICDSTVPSKLKASWFRQPSLKHELKGALSGSFLVSHPECADEWNPLNRATIVLPLLVTQFSSWALSLTHISRYNLGLLVGRYQLKSF